MHLSFIFAPCFTEQVVLVIPSWIEDSHLKRRTIAYPNHLSVFKDFKRLAFASCLNRSSFAVATKSFVGQAKQIDFKSETFAMEPLFRTDFASEEYASFAITLRTNSKEGPTMEASTVAVEA